MVKHIGIIGVSSEGAALSYTTICEYAWKKLGKFVQPEITIHTLSLKDYLVAIEKKDWDSVASLMISSAKKLAKIGANFAICPDNTVHMGFDKLKEKSPIPVLNIMEIVAKECKLKRYKKVGLLGTKFTMEEPIYYDALAKQNIEMLVPNKEDRESVNKIIFIELGPGQINGSTGTKLVKFIEKLKKDGCQAVILGCTELPLVLNDKNSPIPTIDSTRLQARKALEYALK